jgi:hypothetical protein
MPIDPVDVWGFPIIISTISKFRKNNLSIMGESISPPVVAVIP